MSSQAALEIRWRNIKSCLHTCAETLETLADTPGTSVLRPISLTTRSLVIALENSRASLTEYATLLEDTYRVLDGLIALYAESKTTFDLPPSVLNQVGNLATTVNRIYSFVEGQQGSGRIMKFFRQNERSALLKACRAGLQDALDEFKITNIDIRTRMDSILEMAESRHREILELIEARSEAASTDSTSSIVPSMYSSSHSLTMLPAKPKIFHGRQSELSDILKMFEDGIPRIAILGAAGMGKTSLVREVLHQEEVINIFQPHCFFVSCESTSSVEELVVLIGAHLGLLPARTLRKQVLERFSTGPKALLILDNFESVWETLATRTQVEEFVSSLTDVEHLALMITMRGAERPSQVRWTRPFLAPLSPLADSAVHQIFRDIADDLHQPDEVDQVLRLTDNLPLAVTLLAHLVDSQGCSAVLSHWEKETTSLLSDGIDKISNLDLSISLSLTSPRVTPGSLKLLSLLSVLPDGLSEVELSQAKVSVPLGSHTALLRTSLAYSTDQKRIQALAPIREYMRKFHPPPPDLVNPLFDHYRALTHVSITQWGAASNEGVAARIHTSFANIQNLLLFELETTTSDRVALINFILDLNVFTKATTHKKNPCMTHVPALLHPEDHLLKLRYITELLSDVNLSPPSEFSINEALVDLDQVTDLRAKCLFYHALAWRHTGSDDVNAAKDMCRRGLALPGVDQEFRSQSLLLDFLAHLKYREGDYAGGQADARRAHSVAKISGRFTLQAATLMTEARCTIGLGDYCLCISLCQKAMNLLTMSGLSWCNQHHHLLSTQADIHRLKSEYLEAQSLYNKIIALATTEPDPYLHALALNGKAEIDMILGAPRQIVQRNLDAAKRMLDGIGVQSEQQFCDFLQADLDAREESAPDQVVIYEKCFKKSFGQDVQVESSCLEKLAHASRNTASQWPAVLIAHSFKFKRNLWIHKGLQSFAQHFTLEGDPQTAENLLLTSLDGFTWMDVHQSRAECMFELGQIAERNGDPGKAKELWTTAKPLFERSLQAKQVQEVEELLEELDRVKVEDDSREVQMCWF